MRNEITRFVRNQNDLPHEVWIQQPFSVRVALELLDPEGRFVSKEPTDRERLLAEAVIEEHLARYRAQAEPTPTTERKGK